MASDQQIRDVYIAVVGVDGAGKSSLISTCTGQHEQTSHSVDSCKSRRNTPPEYMHTNKTNSVRKTDFPSKAATQVQDTSFIYSDSTRVHLVDIPGFSNDPEDADTDAVQRCTLERIDTFVKEGKSFSGIIFLHPISDEQTTGLALRNLELLRGLCGPEAGASSFAVLATTMWSQVSPEDGERREKELVETDGFFHHMAKEEGSRVFRFEETRESAFHILSYILSQRGGQPTVTTTPPPTRTPTATLDQAIQTDPILDTSTFGTSLQHAREAHMARLAEMYTLMETATREHDTHLQSLFQTKISALESQIADAAEAQAKLQQTLQEVTEHKDMEMCALREEMRAAREEDRRVHEDELERREKSMQEEMVRREEEHRQDRDARVKGVREEMAAEGEARVRTLLEELARETEERVKAARAEVVHEADGRIKAMRGEMEKMKAGWEREQEMNMKAIKAEIVSLREREQDAREKLKRAEMARRGEEYRQPLQAWAVARLWGVGQARTR